MNEFNALRMRSWLKKIKLVYWNTDLSFLIFEIPTDDKIITVTKNKKGWSCDYVETELQYKEREQRLKKQGIKIGDRWGCVLNPYKECIHIQTAKKYIDIRKVGN